MVYICRKYFSDKHQLKEHLASVHEGKKPYDCSICVKKFDSKKRLSEHFSRIHKAWCEMSPFGMESNFGKPNNKIQPQRSHQEIIQLST